MSILSKLKLKKQILPCLQYFTFFFFNYVRSIRHKCSITSHRPLLCSYFEISYNNRLVQPSTAS